MQREISLDTETTGLEPKHGHRLVEIGCVEMVNRIPTGNTFHVYINPEREVPEDAVKVHGITTAFLKDKPKFHEVVDDFLTFISDSKLIIHNADFDIKFLNAELFHAHKREIMPEQVFCTLKYARKQFPGAPASLDALCKRFNVDISAREYHGALLDAQLLSAMYLELMGGSQVSLSLEKKSSATSTHQQEIRREKLEPRPHTASDAELAAHEAFLKKISSPLWETFQDAKAG